MYNKEKGRGTNMDYNDFMKSKHIAERWGELQANYKNLNKTSELKAYHDLLTEFYDYIQSLEAHFFNDEKVADQKNLLTENVATPSKIFNAPKIPETLSFGQEALKGEEDPWFGFNDE